MTTFTINNKRDREEEEEHKTIKIENVEFCMLQFYKSQFEAAQERIAVYERESKKMRRELAHTQEVVHQQHLQIQDLQETNEMLATERDYAEDQLDMEQAEHHMANLELENKSILLAKSEDRFITLMNAVQQLFAAHPELPEDAAQNINDAMGHHFEANPDISDDETESDVDMEEIPEEIETEEQH